MPINYKDYDINWKDVIRPRILKRAGYRCENCGVPNHTDIIRMPNGVWIEADDWDKKFADTKGIKMTYIVLTVSHQDHNVKNNADNNLKALCQKCHLDYDRAYHLEQRKINRGKIE
jgi:hypothetical protein